MLNSSALLHRINHHRRRRSAPSDPTFGETTVGATAYSLPGNRLTGSLFTLTESALVSKITLYRTDEAGVLSKCLIYSKETVNASKLAVTEEVKGGGGATGWYDYPFVPPVSLAPDDYVLAVNSDGTHWIWYSPGAEEQWRDVGATYCAEPDTLDWVGLLPRVISIYATYTVPVVPGVKAMYGGLYLVFPA